MKQSRKDVQPKQEKKPRSGGKSLTYVLSVAILAIIAVALIGGPAIGGATRRGQASFGEYDGEPITVSPGNYFTRTYQNVAAFYQQQGQEITDQVYFSVWQTAYYETVFHMALMSMAGATGVGVSSEAVDRAIAQWPEFQVDGRFSGTEYQSMSSPDRLALRTYLEELLIASQVRADISSAGTYSDVEIEFIADMATTEYRYRYVDFSFDTFPDSEVVAYGEENSNRFQRINVSQITVDSSETDAQSIRTQAVDRISSFEDLARNQSKDEFASEAGERGWVYYWDLEFDFEDIANVDTLFDLGEGEISEVYQTGGRYRIYRVNETPTEPDFTDEETLAEVRNYVTTFERGRIEDYLRIAADEFVSRARDTDFDNAAIEANQTPQLTEYFPVNYGNSNLFPRIGAAANSALSASGAYNETLLESLFSLEPGQVSEPEVLRDYVFVFELDDVRDITGDRRAGLVASLPGQLRQISTTEANQSVVDEDLFVDNFMQTYTTSVLGQ